MVMDHHVTKQTRTTTRKSKQGNDPQTQNKKNKHQPRRGMGVEQLERLRLQNKWKKMTEIPSLHPLQNAVVQFPHHHQLPSAAAAPQMMAFPAGIHGPNLFMDNVVLHPNETPCGYRLIDNPNDMFSVPNYVKCGASDAACDSCFKKKRINSGSNNNLNTPNQFRYGNVIERVDYTGKNLCISPQVRELAMSGYRVRMPEYEFFPGKGGETTSTSWCTEREGMIGLHRGEGSSCVTAVTSNEEGSVCCSVDLSLKL